MGKLVKISMAIVMGLVLTLSLLGTSVSAQNVSPNHSAIVHHSVMATSAQNPEQTKQMTRGQQNTQKTYWHPGHHYYYGPPHYHHHFYHGRYYGGCYRGYRC